MIRARFKANHDDYRPIKWPIKHPYWCTGYAANGDHSIIVAYADNEAQILELWPEARDLDVEAVDGYSFSDRFPCPDWIKEALS